MKKEKEIQKLYGNFIENYDIERHQLVWMEQSEEFRNFWHNKILNNEYPEISEADMDPIIKILDIRARGAREFREEGSEAAAGGFTYQNLWYEMFKSLKENEDIRIIMDELFRATDDNSKIELIDRLKEINKGRGNRLTGEMATMLNAILFAYNPDQYICVVSLEQRFQIIDYFGLNDREIYESYSYGEKIIKTNSDIISGFQEKYGINTTPRALTQFLYSEEVKPLWRR